MLTSRCRNHHNVNIPIINGAAIIKSEGGGGHMGTSTLFDLDQLEKSTIFWGFILPHFDMVSCIKPCVFFLIKGKGYKEIPKERL